MPESPFSRRQFLTLTGVATLAACATVPNANELIGPNASEAAAGSPDILQRQLALQQALSDSPLVAGNQVSLLPTGLEAHKAMFDAMHQARDHINLEYFVFEDVQVGDWTLSELLTGKIAAGVAVNIIYDAYGSRVPRYICSMTSQCGCPHDRVQSAQPARHADWAFTE